ncbi:transglycosylase SLT domain-containing protein [Nocardia colli]|nr:transglycosylase SLT domain-containing protein [Nocardia colli]
MTAAETMTHFWLVELSPPTGARPGLVALIEAARQTIQTSVDRLGAGTPSKAPEFQQLLRDKGLADSQNVSTTTETYNAEKLPALEEVKTELRRQDESVDTSAYETRGVTGDTLATIQSAVHQLQGILGATPAPPPGQQYLPVIVEAPLIHAVFHTVDTVETAMRGATDRVQKLADDIASAAPIYTAHGNTTGAGNGGGIGNGSGVGGGYPMTGPPQIRHASPARARYSSAGSSRSPGGIYGSPTAGIHRPDIETTMDKALDALGIFDPAARENWKRGYRVLIERESGGDPDSVNTTDSNAAAGTPSRGLTQTIPDTFRHNHVDGTSWSITDPVANVAASMQYVINQYGVARDGHDLQALVQQADPTRNPKGY